MNWENSWVLILSLSSLAIVILIGFFQDNRSDNNRSDRSNKSDNNKSDKSDRSDRSDRSNKSNSNRSDSGSEKRKNIRKMKDKIITDSHQLIIKQGVIIDGLSLVVANLDEKVKQLDHTVENIKQDNKSTVANISKNFSIIANNLMDFQKELKILRDAIFIPVSDDDSEISNTDNGESDFK